MSIVTTLVCVLLSLGWGGTGMAQARPPESAMDPEVKAPALPDTEQAERAAAERRSPGLTSLLVPLRMVFVPGGSFMMGCTREQRECEDWENPVHEVQVSDFEIGQYEVTQELWEAVMGENPSMSPDCAQCPVEQVSWEDIQRFIRKLSVQMGSQYRLPTEAEWEYAARGGRQSRGYQYAGSDILGVVGWYSASVNPVGQKEPNELGVYDMSGNVEERVQDCWHDSYEGAPSDGRAWGSENSGDCSDRVSRGGSWCYGGPWGPGGRVAERSRYTEPNPCYGFRLARTPPLYWAAERAQAEHADAERRQPGFTPLLVPRPMVSIPGGSFMMGCIREQRECATDEYPVREVQVSDFEIGQYEVTQELWAAVMGENSSYFTDCAQCPVENVSWVDVQWFIRILNVQTGDQYRLPTEAEWEYAARGGQQSRGYEYAGSPTPDLVAWYGENDGERTHPVGQKEPNELGLYDMSGNVWEWVEDCWHDSYTGAPADGRAWASENSGDCSMRVRRGGSKNNDPRDLRFANRYWNATGDRDSYIGFRLARTPPQYRAAERAKAERAKAERDDAERRRQVRLNQLPDRFVSIPGGSFRMGCTQEPRDCWDGEQPVHEVQVSDFEIGQYEVTQELWADVMGENPSYFMNCAQCPVENVSWNKVQQFLRKLNVQTGDQYRLPTEAEWEYAARGGQQSRGYEYAGSSTPDVVAWYWENGGERTHPVGQKEPNELGLYDMSGNVWEWVEDCWHDSYKGALADGRAWESENSGDCSMNVLRGGSWGDTPRSLRAASRIWYSFWISYPLGGVRLARTLTP